MSIKFHNIFSHKNFYEQNKNLEISENTQKVNFDISRILYKLEGDIEKEDIDIEDYRKYDLESLFNFIKNGDLKKLNIDSDFFVEAMTILFENYDKIKFSENISEEEFVNVYINNGLENIILINLPFVFQEKEKILEKILKRNSYETIRIILDNGEYEILEILKNFLEKKDNNFIEGILELFIGTKNLHLILKNLAVFGEEKDILEFFLERDFENTMSSIIDNAIFYSFSDNFKKYYKNNLEEKLDEKIIKSLSQISFIDENAQKSINKKIDEIKNDKKLIREYFAWLNYLKNIMWKNSLIQSFDNEEKNLFVGKVIKKLNSIYLKDINNIKNIYKKHKVTPIIVSAVLFESLADSIDLDDLNLEKIGFKLDLLEGYLVEEKVDLFMNLYKQNYDNINFLAEIEQGLNESFKKEGTETYLLVNNSEILFSSYLEYKKDGIYWGGLNTSLDFAYYGFGTWFIDKIIEEKGEENDIFCTVTTEIDGEKNKRYKALLRLYEKKGFKKDGTGENSSSKFIKLRRKKLEKS